MGCPGHLAAIPSLTRVERRFGFTVAQAHTGHEDSNWGARAISTTDTYVRAGGRLVQPIRPGGKEQVVLFQRSAAGLERRQVLTLARFVRLHGRHGFRSRP